jgi:hypothetical protein
MDCLKLGQLFLNRSVPPENYPRTVDMVDPVRVIAAPLVHAVEGTEPTISKPLCKIIGSAKRLMKLAKLLGKFFSLEKHPKSADLSLKRLSDKPLILHAAPPEYRRYRGTTRELVKAFGKRAEMWCYRGDLLSGRVFGGK